MTSIDDHIYALDSIDTTNPQAALTQVWANVASVNADALKADAVKAGRGKQEDLIFDGLADRLQDWLNKLVEKLQAIARSAVGAMSFTVSVGTPFNVSVAVTFAKAT
jgi:hypothetical protein